MATKKQKNIFVLSIGGSIIIPPSGFDTKFLQSFRRLILKHVKLGKQFVLVIGGGATCRQYQDGLKKTIKISNTDLDWMGIATTVLNAEFIKFLFGSKLTYKEVLRDPDYKVKTKKSIIIAAGDKPGRSTDDDAVKLASVYGAKTLMNLSNISYVYDKDPNKYKNAKKIKRISWKDFRKNIVGNVWDPGKNAPFDPIASRRAEQLGLCVEILKGTDLKQVDRALFGKSFEGTIVE